MSTYTVSKSHRYSFLTARLLALLLLLCTVLPAEEKPGLEEHPGGLVPLDVPFRDETGRRVTFGELMDGRPAILTLNYYGCPSLCTPQLNDLAKSLTRVKLAEKSEYRVITLSFNPDETPEKAAGKKADLLASMARPFDAGAWTFLTGTEADIRSVTQSVGFHYAKQAGPSGMVDYIHPAVLVALSPEGKITRYLNGVKQLPFDIQMAMMEASEGTVRPTIAKTLLFCFAFDPKNKTYVFAAEKVGAVVLSLILAGFFLYLVRSGRKRPEEENKHDS
jgi:protein SCO1/2